MSRHRRQHSYGHAITRIGCDYLISWMVDRYYRGSRLRHPQRYERVTDEEGARRFAKRWGVRFDDEEDRLSGVLDTLKRDVGGHDARAGNATSAPSRERDG